MNVALMRPKLQPIRLLLLAFAFATAIPAVAYAQSTMPWSNETFERTSQNEDIRTVIRSILRQNNMNVIYRPGVDGRITARFQGIPLEGAFNKLMTENDLEYEYDAGTRTVTVFPRGESLRGQEFFTLKFAEINQVRAAKQRFGLLGDISYDPSSGVVLLSGTPDQVAALSELIQRIEDAEAQRAEIAEQRRQIEERASDAEIKVARERAEIKARETEVTRIEQNNALRQELLRELQTVDVEIIPLKYANVNATSQTFQGETVSVPGIAETLRSLMGISETADTGGTDLGPGVVTAAYVPADGVVAAERLRQYSEVGLEPPRPMITTDARTNSVIIRGTEKARTQLKKLLLELDREVEMIEIEVLIVRAREGLTRQLGVNWAAGTRFFTGDGEGFAGITTNPGTGTTDALGALTASVVPETLLPAAAGPGGATASFLINTSNTVLAAELSALSADDQARTIASPRVVTLNNTPSKITNNLDLIVRIDTGDEGGAGDVERINTGVSLDITPAIINDRNQSGERMLRMAITATNTAPTVVAGEIAVSGNEVQTQVLVPEGNTFVLGGFLSDTRGENKSGVLGLMDIPLLGELFKFRESLKDLDETIFFITPRIVQRSDIQPEDIALDRYLPRQRQRLAEIHEDLSTKSQLLPMDIAGLEEDE